MGNFKRYTTIVAATFMVMGTPLIAHALTPSEESASVFPAEGNGKCSDYAENGVIQSITGDVTPGASTTATDGTATATVTFNGDATSLSFDSDTNIDFALVKKSRHIGVFIYQSGGTKIDSGVNLGDIDITNYALCYGLDNEPVNAAPVLDPIGDKAIKLVDPLTFSVTASDDGKPDGSTLDVTWTALPGDATVTYNAGTDSYDFNWSSATALTDGSMDVTFTASDGVLEDSETITITVQEPLETADCAFLSDASLDSTGISCPDPVADPETGVLTYPRSLVCNLELDEEFFGLDINEHCCICNQDGGSSDPAPLIQCDPSIPAGGAAVNGVESCFDGSTTKAPLEVTTHLEFNNDPYYCYTSGGSRICYKY